MCLGNAKCVQFQLNQTLGVITDKLKTLDFGNIWFYISCKPKAKRYQQSFMNSFCIYCKSHCHRNIQTHVPYNACFPNIVWYYWAFPTLRRKQEWKHLCHFDPLLINNKNYRNRTTVDDATPHSVRPWAVTVGIGLSASDTIFNFGSHLSPCLPRWMHSYMYSHFFITSLFCNRKSFLEQSQISVVLHRCGNSINCVVAGLHLERSLILIVVFNSVLLS